MPVSKDARRVDLGRLLAEHYPLVIVVLTTIVVTLLSRSTHPIPPAVHDALAYVNVAQGIVANHVFAYDSEVPNATLTPGYPLVLAFIFALVPRGGSAVDWAVNAQPFVYAMQLMMVVGTALCTMRAGLAIGGRRVAAVSGMLAALYLPYYWAASAHLSDVLGSLVIAAALWVGVVLASKSKPAPLHLFAVFGLITGVIGMVRPAFVLWPIVPLVYVALLRTMPMSQYAKRAAVFLAAAVLVMAPWWIRNVIVLDKLVLLSTNSGVTMLDGLGGRELSPEEEVIADRAEAEGRDPWTAAARYRARTYFEEAPVEFIEWRNLEVWLAVKFPWNAVADAHWEHANHYDEKRIDYGDFSGTPSDALLRQQDWITWFHSAALVFALVGVVFARYSRRLLICASLPLYTMAVHYMTMFAIRYFLPAMSAVFVLAAAGIVGLYVWAKRALAQRAAVSEG